MTIQEAIDQLNRSGRGRRAMSDLLAFFDNGGLSLDRFNREAVLTLVTEAFGSHPGSVCDALRDRAR